MGEEALESTNAVSHKNDDIKKRTRRWVDHSESKSVISYSLYYDIMRDNKCSGLVRDDLKEVSERFRKLLSNEREGLALAVYKNDALVVDLWGGFAEKKIKKTWQEDTLTVTFSTSKIVGALIIAILVSRGQLQYEKLVTDYWPEFGQNGKENTTVEWVVGHKAGLITFDDDLTISQCSDHSYVSCVIEKTKPRWRPGTVTAYHALTYGFLVDQLVRRADPKSRGIGDFFREEIVPYMKDKDFYIGLPEISHNRMAKITPQNKLKILKFALTDFAYIKILLNSILSGYSYCNSPLSIASRYPSCFNLSKLTTYNDPSVWKLENIAAFGVGTARGLASVVSAIMQNNLISPEVWNIISKPTEFVKDEVIQLKHYRGHGFFYKPHPTRKDSFLLEHVGFGMQKVVFDPTCKISMALLRNGLTWELRKDREADRIASVILKEIAD